MLLVTSLLTKSWTGDRNYRKSQRFPILLATEAEQKAIESLVQKCLEAKGQNVTQWEREIDEKVAKLYGLSEEEMQIIQNTD